MSILPKSEFAQVNGEIYKITNTVTNKCYIGQTRTHRLNHGKYRPFGHMGRFKDHISESKSNKKNQSKYLNYAIIKYGEDNFTCELLVTCKLEELNDYEIQYIKDLGTKYPNGYNLTDGGQCIGKCPIEIVIEKTNVEKIPKKHSDETKKLISENIKNAINNREHLIQMMKTVQTQHLEKKFRMLMHAEIDETSPMNHIKIKRNTTTGLEYVQLTFKNASTTFVGKYEGIEDIKNRALCFLEELIKRRRDQIAGSPLEPSLPLPGGNVLEELG